jgi:hypothetical protein
MVNAFTFNKESDLVKTARNSIHFCSNRWNGKTMNNVGRCNKNTDMNIGRESKAIINLEKTELSIFKVFFPNKIRIKFNFFVFFVDIITILIRSVPLVSDYLDGKSRINYLINGIKKGKRWNSNGDKNQGRGYCSSNLNGTSMGCVDISRRVHVFSIVDNCFEE